MYYQPVEPAESLEREEYIKSRIDCCTQNSATLVIGKSKRKSLRQEDGIAIGRKLVRRYMAEMNICPVYPKSNLSKPGKNSLKISVSAEKSKIDRPNQVWSMTSPISKWNSLAICI